MLQALLVTFREGIESFLIVGVVIAYLKKSQRPGLVRGVKIGLAISVVSCPAGAWLWLQVPNQPLYEGIAALCAAIVVGALLAELDFQAVGEEGEKTGYLGVKISEG